MAYIQGKVEERKLLSDHRMRMGDVIFHGSVSHCYPWLTGIWGHIVHNDCKKDAVIPTDPRHNWLGCGLLMHYTLFAMKDGSNSK